MSNSQKRSIASRARSFLVFPFPFLLAWAAILYLPRDIAAPEFTTHWSVTTKFLVAFLAMVSGMLVFQVALYFWAKWIDPDSHAKRERVLSNEIDQFAFLGNMLAIAAYMPFAKELDLSFGTIAACFTAWFVTATALSTLARRYETPAPLRKDSANTPVRTTEP